MKAIVTGGAGFIGSHLVDLLLERGHEVVVIDDFSTGRPQNLAHLKDHKRFRLCRHSVDHDGGLENPRAVEAAMAYASADWVFHLAAKADIVPSITDPNGYFSSNVVGTYKTLQCAKAAEARRFIYAASSSCYGLPDLVPTPETADMRPQYPYALTKRLGEEMVLHWGQVYGLPVVSLRFFNVYGPRSRTGGTYGAVFGVFLAQKLAGQPLTIVGDGTQTRDFIYVKDVAKALLAAAESEVTGRVYNVGAGNPVSVNHIAELIGGERVDIPKRPGEPDVTHADITRIAAELGWRPETSIEEGVARIMERIDDWKDAPVWTPDAIDVATKDWFKYLGKA
jgi:UDP-glucose 4-epimerase